jgi:hypothetical protein
MEKESIMTTYIVKNKSPMYFVKKEGADWKIIDYYITQREFGFESSWIEDDSHRPCSCHSAKVFRHMHAGYVMFYDECLIATDLSIAEWSRQNRVAPTELAIGECNCVSSNEVCDGDFDYDGRCIDMAINMIEEGVSELKNDNGVVLRSELISYLAEGFEDIEMELSDWQSSSCTKDLAWYMEFFKVGKFAIYLVEDDEAMADLGLSQILVA